MSAMGPNETKLRAALATADFDRAIGRSLGWTYSGFDLKWVGDALRDVAPRLGDYGMTGSTPDSANAAFLRLAERVDARWKEMEKAGQALSDAAGAFGDADQMLKDNPASKTDPGSFTYDPNSSDDEQTQRLAHSGKAEAYSREHDAREQKFAAVLKSVDLAYRSSSQKLAEVHGLEPPPGLDTPGTPGGGPGGPVPGGGGSDSGHPWVPDSDDPPLDIPRDIPREPPVGPEPRDPEPRDSEPRDSEPRDPEPREAEPCEADWDWGPDPYGPRGDPADPTPGTPLGDPTGPQPGTYTPGGYTPVRGGATPQDAGPPPGLMGALPGGLIGGGAAGAVGMARGVGAVDASGSSAKSIGATSSAGSVGGLGRGGTTGTAGAAGAAGATRAGGAGAARGGPAKGAGGSRGAAGSRGRRSTDERSAKRDGLDSIAESSEWIDDDGAAPGVID